MCCRQGHSCTGACGLCPAVYLSRQGHYHPTALHQRRLGTNGKCGVTLWVGITCGAWGYAPWSARSTTSAGEIADGESPPHTGKPAPRMPNMSQLAGGRRSSKDQAAPNGGWGLSQDSHSAWVAMSPSPTGGPCAVPVPMGAPEFCTQGCQRGQLLPCAQGAEQVHKPVHAGNLLGSAAATGCAAALAAGPWCWEWVHGKPLSSRPGLGTRPACSGFPVLWGLLLCPAPCPLAPRPSAAPAPVPSGPPLRAVPVPWHYLHCCSISSLIYFCCSAARLFSLLLSRLQVSSAQRC